MKETISIIVVNHNGKKYLRPCFDSLLRIDKGNFSLEIIMVDNLSKDNSISFIKEGFPRVKVVENNINSYTKALNLGIGISQSDYIAILNNDMTVEKEWLKGLMKVMKQDERIGVVQSKIIFTDKKTINSVGVEEVEDLYFKDIAVGEEDIGKYEDVRELEYFSGGSALLRRACIENVGGFDEDFMFYVEDLDYSLRCRKKGWKIFYCPKSVVYHRFHGTASRKFCEYFCSRNRLLFIAKHFPLKLPESIGTSRFRHRSQYDELNYALIQAVAKMAEHNDIKTSREVLNKLKDTTIDLFETHKTYKFLDFMLRHNYSTPTGWQWSINAFKDRICKTPVLGSLAKLAVSIARLLISRKANEN
jgi:GT2 family glycosyltransferase